MCGEDNDISTGLMLTPCCQEVSEVLRLVVVVSKAIVEIGRRKKGSSIFKRGTYIWLG